MKIHSYRGEYTFQFSDLTEKLVGSLASKSFLVIDSNVYRLYPIFGRMFSSDNTFVVMASEEAKTLKTCSGLVNLLVEKGFKRNHRLVAVGTRYSSRYYSFHRLCALSGCRLDFLANNPSSPSG